MTEANASGPHEISLALQGGGAHGAFEWGVLDALLKDGRVSPTALSGVSAGAMNACACATGLTSGGHDGARSTLAAFWLDEHHAALAALRWARHALASPFDPI